MAINGGSGQARFALKNDSTGDASGDGLQIVLDTTAGGIEMRENLPLYFTTNNTERMKIDTSGNVLLTSGTGGLGYGTGAGGTVTQLTSKSTAVTLNKPTGTITMNSAALAAGASVTFVLNNTLLAYHDRLIVNGVWGLINPQFYRIECAGVWAGVGVIRVTNITAGNLSEAVEIEFSILKGANV